MVAAQETSLQKILEGTCQYLVPLYQRPYQWGPDNFKELWRDITQLAEDRITEIDTTHFIGSVVLAPVPAGVAGTITQYLVVDGQQRFTTLILLLAAIRDHLRAIDDTTRRDTDRIHNQLLTNQYEDDPYRLKLLPTQSDRESFTAVIDALPTAGGDDNIGAAYRFFRARLSEPVDPDASYDAVQIAHAVTSGLSVVSISTHPGDNVHRIFQSLNNTGLKLTQNDLLRNYLFMRLPTQGETVYRAYWRPLQEALVDNERLETLFWLDLLHTRPQVKQSQTFAGQQARLDRLTNEEEIVAEVMRTAELGHLYRLMLQPEQESDSGVRERLVRLGEWGSTTPAPLVLHLLVLRARGSASSEQVARALLYIESLLVRRFLIGQSAQSLNRLFAAAVQELDTALPVDEALHRYLSGGRKHYATDEKLTEAILTSPLYTTGRAAQRKTVLTWIENATDLVASVAHGTRRDLRTRERRRPARQHGAHARKSHVDRIQRRSRESRVRPQTRTSACQQHTNEPGDRRAFGLGAQTDRTTRPGPGSANHRGVAGPACGTRALPGRQPAVAVDAPIAGAAADRALDHLR